MYDTFSHLIFTHDGDDVEPHGTVKVTIEVEYYPAYVPSDFGLIDIISTPNTNVLTYRNEDFFFEINQTIAKGTAMNIDNENTQEEAVTINDNNGIYFSNGEYQNYIWQSNGYVFYVYGNIEKEILFEIALSLVPE